MKKLWFLIVLLAGFTGFLSAQAPSAILDYFEDGSGEFKVVTAEGQEFYSTDIDFGWEIPVGSTLVTFDGDYAELTLVPNGTIIRISQNTNFRVEALQGRGGAGGNVFSVAVGKFRAVASKSTGNELYSFKGPSAVMGVRGTDLGMWVVPGEQELAFVLDGLIDYTNSAGQTIAVGAGQMADAFGPVFQSMALTQQMMNSLLGDLQFQKASPPQPRTVEAAEAVEPDEAESRSEPPVEPARDGPFAKLLQLLGVEIGAVTLGNETWAKAIIQPRFHFGKWKLALYLPFIYQSNLFDPNDWYRPAGNDEWSFGTDQSGWDRVALDFVSDLFLKIRTIEYAEQRDPFFFKAGNIEGVNLGHRLLMRDYRNDADFPAVRRVGLNLGVDKEKGGFELLTNNLAAPEILAARLYTRPMGSAFPLALGFSAAADLEPGAWYVEHPATGTYENYGRPIFLNAGLDLELPVIDRDLLSIVLFSDVGAMMPYFREAVPTTTIDSGLALEALWDSAAGRPRNWGLAAGVLGNVAILDYRLEYRYSNGTFRNGFYDAFYERLRHLYVADVVEYLKNPADPEFNVKRMGIYGEAGFSLGELFSLRAGYEWPWYLDGTGGTARDDYFLLQAALLKPLPVVRLQGSVSYERVRLIDTLMGKESLKLFDQNTVFTGELLYPISPIMNIAVLISTTAVDDGSGRLEPFTSVSIVTRVNY